MQRKIWVKVMVLFASGLLPWKSVLADPGHTDASTPGKSTKLLQFVLTGQQARFKSKDESNRRYLLELKDVKSDVVFFTNRPRRIADTMKVGFFLKRWLKPPPH